MAGTIAAPPPGRGRRPHRIPLAGLALLVVLAGCRVDVGVDITLQRAGGGEISVSLVLDADAVDRLGGDLDAVLELDDLRDTGWLVEGPEQLADGGAAMTARKAFAGPDHAVEVLAEVAGTGGPLRDVSLGRETAFARTEWWVDATADLRDGLEMFGDEMLAAELDGMPVGRTVEDLEAELGEPLADVVSFTVGASLPAGTVERWEVPYGEGPVALALRSSERRTEVLVWLGVAGGLALLFAALMTWRAVQRFRTRRHRPAHAA